MTSTPADENPWTVIPDRVLTVLMDETREGETHKSRSVDDDRTERMSMQVNTDGRSGLKYEVADEQMNGVVVAFPVGDDTWECSAWVLPYKEEDKAAAALILAVAQTEPPMNETLLTPGSSYASWQWRRRVRNTENMDGVAVISAFWALLSETFAFANTHIIREVLVGFHPWTVELLGGNQRNPVPYGQNARSMEAVDRRAVCYVAGDWMGYDVTFSYWSGVAEVEVRNDPVRQPLWIGSLVLSPQGANTLRSFRQEIPNIRERILRDRRMLTEAGLGSVVERFEEQGTRASMSEEELAIVFALLIDMLQEAKYSFLFHVKGDEKGERFGPGAPYSVPAETLEHAKRMLLADPRLHRYDPESAEPDDRVFPDEMPVFPVAAGE